MSATLFIDANQYLALYQGVEGCKTLLDNLEEQKAYIFLSAQIVDEVLRNKLRCARVFFSGKLKEIQNEILGEPLPDHLPGISDAETNEFRKKNRASAGGEKET